MWGEECGVWGIAGAVGCWVRCKGSLGAGLSLVALGEYSRARLVLPGVFLGSGREVLAMGGCFLAGGLSLLRRASPPVARLAGPTPPACGESDTPVLAHVNLGLRPPNSRGPLRRDPLLLGAPAWPCPPLAAGWGLPGGGGGKDGAGRWAVQRVWLGDTPAGRCGCAQTPGSWAPLVPRGLLLGRESPPGWWRSILEAEGRSGGRPAPASAGLQSGESQRVGHD